MKKCLPLPLLLCINHIAPAQNAYFQQEVNYSIDVSLDDVNHTLQGTINIEYINHSPDELDSIYFHLWGNAYKDQATAFAQQELRRGKTRFYFAKKEELGHFSQLDFKVDGQKVSWELDKKNPDIAVLILKQALESGGKLNISTAFTLKIPASFSRLGHVGQSYQMTQWYPKPAVYDREGWHPIPYLDMGEFYSEFGSFDVSITLPENYVVAATGMLQTESEKAFLNKKIEETTAYFKNPGRENALEPDSFPPSSPKLKTIRFTAEKVHDFAWFADKRFKVRKSVCQLPSGRKIDTWVMFTKEEEDLWKDAVNYVNRAVTYYSNLVGAYPWPQATAVQSALSAGGGMEYPMITVIGLSGESQSLDEVITHEVGHNWFYGILAFNEREHAWLDEGINSYYDHRYSEKYYGETGRDFLPEFLYGESEMDFGELAYLYQARRNLDQAPETQADAFTTINYFLSSYEKPAIVFKYLENYLGKEAFDRIMRAFYTKWKFKHPQPADFRRHLEEQSVKKMGWLFDGFLYSNKKMAYALRELTEGEAYTILVKNKGEIAAPFTLSGIKDGKIANTIWYEGFSGEKQFNFPGGDFELIVLDAHRYAPELNRKNNNIKTTGRFKTVEPLQFKLLPEVENDKRSVFYFLPTIAWNNYDKSMLGILLYNTTVPAKRFEFASVAMFATGTIASAGMEQIKYHIYPRSGIFHHITLGYDQKHFHFDYVAKDNYDLAYRRDVFSIKTDIRKKPASNFHQRLQVRSILLGTESDVRDNDGNYLRNEWNYTGIHELSYWAENRRALHPFSLKLAFEQQSYEDISGDQNYLKAFLDWKSSFTYREGKNISLRIFVGGFLKNTKRHGGRIFPGAFNLASRGSNDYRFDDLYFGRSEDKGLWSQQISLRDGGFKNVIESSFMLGRSNNFIIAMNLKADLPPRIPLKPYFDIGYFDNAMPTGQGDSLQDQLLWSGGVALELIDGIFGLYFPLVNSQNLQDLNAQRGNYWTRISFQLDLNRANPFDWVGRIGVE